jgi:hypothetical protein
MQPRIRMRIANSLQARGNRLSMYDGCFSGRPRADIFTYHNPFPARSTQLPALSTRYPGHRHAFSTATPYANRFTRVYPSIPTRPNHYPFSSLYFRRYSCPRSCVYPRSAVPPPRCAVETPPTAAFPYSVELPRNSSIPSYYPLSSRIGRAIRFLLLSLPILFLEYPPRTGSQGLTPLGRVYPPAPGRYFQSHPLFDRRDIHAIAVPTAVCPVVATSAPRAFIYRWIDCKDIRPILSRDVANVPRRIPSSCLR